MQHDLEHAERKHGWTERNDRHELDTQPQENIDGMKSVAGDGVKMQTTPYSYGMKHDMLQIG